MKQPVIIAGAGPAGLTAAITLAHAGYAVEVFERNGDSGTRFSGDLQGLENWSRDEDILALLQDMGIAVNFSCAPLQQLTVTNGEQTVELPPFSRPLAYLVQRGTAAGSLDQGLKAQALALGVRIHYGTMAPSERADIVATGPIMKQLVAIAKGVVFRTDHPDGAYGLLHDGAAEKGYAYLLITKGHGCLCTVLFDRFSTLNTAFAKTQSIFEKLIPVQMTDVQQVGGVGGFSLHHQWTDGGRRFVGEAAGVQDLLWGFGIYSAMYSGWLAAQSLVQGTDYAKAARSYFGPRAKAGVVNRYLWERFAKSEYVTVLKRLHATGDPIKLLHSFFGFNLPQRLLYPVAAYQVHKRYPWL